MYYSPEETLQISRCLKMLGDIDRHARGRGCAPLYNPPSAYSLREQYLESRRVPNLYYTFKDFKDKHCVEISLFFHARSCLYTIGAKGFSLPASFGCALVSLVDPDDKLALYKHYDVSADFVNAVRLWRSAVALYVNQGMQYGLF